MTVKELKDYFKMLESFSQVTGVKKENRKTLVKIENLKLLLLDTYVGAINSEFQGQEHITELESWVNNNENIKRIWDRDDDSKYRVPGRPQKEDKIDMSGAYVDIFARYPHIAARTLAGQQDQYANDLPSTGL